MRFPKLTKKRVIVSVIILIVGSIIFTQTVKPKRLPVGTNEMVSVSQATDDKLTADALILPGSYAELSFPDQLVGTVKSVKINDGDVVTKGQLLLSLNSDEAIQAQRQAQDKLDQARKKYTSARRIDAGNLNLRRIAARLELAQAQQKLNQLRAKPTPAEVAVAQQAIKDARGRLDALVATGTATASEIVAAQYTVTVAQNNLAEVNKGANADELNVAQINVDKAQQVYNGISNGLAIGDTAGNTADTARAEVKVAEIELSKAKAEVNKYELYSPIGGKIVFVGAKEGEAVKGGTILIRVADTSSWKLKTINVTETDIYKIQPNQRVTFTLDAMPNEKFDGTVETVQNFGSSDRGDVTYPVVIKIEKNDDRFRWGMLSLVTFPVK